MLRNKSFPCSPVAPRRTSSSHTIAFGFVATISTREMFGRVCAYELKTKAAHIIAFVKIVFVASFINASDE
jgi:hypothetical protein